MSGHDGRANRSIPWRLEASTGGANMMHEMFWPMIAAGTLEITVLGLAVAALVKYLFSTTSSDPTH
jgi:hypothetical protein